ncbi:DNA-binding LacI/PurR family transcriptional regulator [Paenibacillus phyllosphaerae]|uniref:DNA-binding LacI/PurR family transcriptional regulator n=1 Tax=Paenibacillus phyllosphaerae TaxID=274593 RepID=A0A7W5B2Z5_9BACL|nr:LacI family DNA-binding transcriptional regulator [Paenibacillus phyllosphaerae]MBB3113475.1 DNA-binding LacI/PurR family transcriptional regulator [Paenibacillus phyllosphaerae]
MKKTTLKDIALEAGVSVATVSYILNNVQNQTIPEDTRRKVQETASRLNYVPNLTAKSLVKGETKLIGILINRGPRIEPWRSIPQERFVMELERLMTAEGYHVIVVSLDAAAPKLDVVVERKLDGVFLIDVHEEAFYSISNRFKMGVPLVVIDSLIEDDLFHKIVPDFANALRIAAEQQTSEIALITERFHNQALNALLEQTLSLPSGAYHWMADEDQLRHFVDEQTQRGRHIVVVNEIIGLYAAKHTDPAKLTVICTSDLASLLPPDVRTITFRNKAAIAFDVMMKHIRRLPS